MVRCSESESGMSGQFCVWVGVCLLHASIENSLLERERSVGGCVGGCVGGWVRRWVGA